jgi:hypothetical protein
MTVEHNKRGGKGSCSREDAPQEASAKTQATQLSTTDERTESPSEIEVRDDVITYSRNLSLNLGFLNSSFYPFLLDPAIPLPSFTSSCMVGQKKQWKNYFFIYLPYL